MYRRTLSSVNLSAAVVLRYDGKLKLFTNEKNRDRIPWSSTDGRVDLRVNEESPGFTGQGAG